MVLFSFFSFFFLLSYTFLIRANWCQNGWRQFFIIECCAIRDIRREGDGDYMNNLKGLTAGNGSGTTVNATMNKNYRHRNWNMFCPLLMPRPPRHFVASIKSTSFHSSLPCTVLIQLFLYFITDSYPRTYECLASGTVGHHPPPAQHPEKRLVPRIARR